MNDELRSGNLLMMSEGANTLSNNNTCSHEGANALSNDEMSTSFI